LKISRNIRTVKVLVDTNVFLKVTFDPQSLPGRLTDAIEAAEQLFVSMASAWEMTVKAGLGKLRVPGTAADFVHERAVQLRATILHVELRHLHVLQDLPNHHRDPFDRLLIAQAFSENLRLATSDPKFEAYGVDLI
jgi:PIN domain nuclease of toxin-antitoxin system